MKDSPRKATEHDSPNDTAAQDATKKVSGVKVLLVIAVIVLVTLGVIAAVGWGQA